MVAKITKAYVRHYSDNGQTMAYVEWIDHKGKRGRTEGDENSLHMAALLSRAKREGIAVTRETW